MLTYNAFSLITSYCIIKRELVGIDLKDANVDTPRGSTKQSLGESHGLSELR